MRARHPVQPGRRLGLPLESWPLADQIAWNAAFQPNGLKGAPGAKLGLHSRLATATGYARWLLWLTTHHPATLAWRPEARASEERVIAYLEGLTDQVTPRTLMAYAENLKRALTLLAPHEDWAWFKPILRRAQRWVKQTRPVRRPFVPSDQLFAFGIALMDQAADIAPHTRAEMFRDGLMIAFLAARPLRLMNLMGLEINTQFVATADGYRVALGGERTKNKAPLEFPIPASLVPYMARYLADHRPVLAAGPQAAADSTPAEYLWLARSGAPFPADTFATMITRRTHRHFGKGLTPHDFRRCAATTIAQANPEEFHIIRFILGHSSSATADRYYIRAKGIEATKLVQANVIKTRKTLARRDLRLDRQ